MKGKLIVLEGLDGSGKATQAQMLYDYWRTARSPQVQKVTFPNYESDSSALVKMYLAGEFGTSAQDVNAYAASLFYSVDRYASYRKDWGAFYEDGGVIIADRYTTSNAVHQCAKLPRREWASYLDWLFSLEYEKMGIPRPDLVIYLDVDLEVSQRLMESRYHGDADKKDIHEKDVAYLRQSRRAATYCAKELGWQVVSCSNGEEMRTREEIFEEIKRMTESL